MMRFGMVGFASMGANIPDHLAADSVDVVAFESGASARAGPGGHPVRRDDDRVSGRGNNKAKGGG